MEFQTLLLNKKTFLWRLTSNQIEAVLQLATRPDGAEGQTSYNRKLSQIACYFLILKLKIPPT